MLRAIVAAIALIALASCGKSNDEREQQKLSFAAEDATAAAENVAERAFERIEPAEIGILPPGITPEYLAKSVFETCKRQQPIAPGGVAACRSNAELGSIFAGRISVTFATRPDVQTMISNCIRAYTENEITDFALVGGCVRNGRGMSKLQPAENPNS